MPIPIIDPETSVQSHRVGDAVFFQANASGSPTLWATTGLPPGLSLATSTGLVTGSPTHAGVYDARFKAQNGDGWSAEATLTWGIEVADYTQDDSVEVDVDVSTGQVSFPGGGSGGFGKLGDSVVLMVGFRKYGVLLDLPIALLRVGFKEFDDGPTLWLSDGDFTRVGADESTRYRIVATLERSAFSAAVSGYAEDKKTIMDAVAEFEWLVSNTDPGLTPAVLRRSSRGFTFFTGTDLVTDAPAP